MELLQRQTMCLILVLLCLWWPIVTGAVTTEEAYEDYTYHPCIRPCTLHSPPMECVYNFTLEYYTAFGKECRDCPRDPTDCFRRGCITADGNNRVIMTVNKQLPGPAIHVCENDMVIVRVTNNLLGTEGTTIHWHGQLMQGYQYMDGTSRVTQCNIPASASFEYRFPASTPGSHLWHDHSGPARCEGIFGALVVRQPPEMEAHLGLYDLDLPEHTLVVMDWMKKPAAEIFALAYMGKGYKKQTTILVNGRRVEEEFFTSTNRTGRNFLPMARFTVDQGLRYRFRVISNGVNECPIQISIDGHNLTVIATDGVPFVKVEVQSLYLHSGERYDFVLNANQDVGNYWMRFQGTEFGCKGSKAYGAAILRYTGAPDDYPVAKFNSYEDAAMDGTSLNKWNVQESSTNLLLTSLQGLDMDKAALKPAPDRTIYLSMSMRMQYAYSLGLVWLNQINGISLLNPPAPPLTQLRDLHESIFCTEDSPGYENCTKRHCECVYRQQVALGDVVELVMLDEGVAGTTVHPMHLHGYKVYIVGMGKLGEETTLEEVKRLDRENKLPRNLATPVAKDTVAVSDGGYVIMRWHATNPGFWLFHCHTEYHMIEGMGMIFQVGEPEDMPRIPAQFPRCGNWQFSGFPEEEESEEYETQRDGDQACNSAMAVGHSIGLFAVTFTIVETMFCF